MNGLKKNQVDVLAVDISKAKFVLGRDHVDLHVEEFLDFGAGIDGVLRRVRLQQSLIKPEDIAKYVEQVKTEGALVRNNGLLLIFDAQGEPGLL